MIRDSAHPPRIVLYSHDTMGLGHVRRNLLLAKMFAASHLKPNVLLLSGAVEAKSFQLPPGVDCVTLPSLYKEPDGRYRPRRLRMPLEGLIEIRREILRSSVAAFDPDLLIVDTAPWGAVQELEETLEYLAEDGRARRVLGVRDVWDEPEAIAREWAGKRNWDAIRRYYDEVWVYGDPNVYDTVQEYDVGEDLALKFRYTGYLGRTPDVLAPVIDSAGNDGHEYRRDPYVLCLMGGGQDGVRLGEAFLEADLPEGRNGLLIAGPYMDPDELAWLRTLAAHNDRMTVIDFIPEPIGFVQDADAVVSMGGYNAVCEILSLRKRALIVPRVEPRREQMIRAERLEALDALDLLHPAELTPQAISDFLRTVDARPSPRVAVDMNGLRRVLRLTEARLLEQDQRP